jgi:hypothetical protein
MTAWRTGSPLASDALTRTHQCSCTTVELSRGNQHPNVARAQHLDPVPRRCAARATRPESSSNSDTRGQTESRTDRTALCWTITKYALSCIAAFPRAETVFRHAFDHGVGIP